MMLRRVLLAAALLLGAAPAALAQSSPHWGPANVRLPAAPFSGGRLGLGNSPGWVLGYVPTPSEWNSEWASKQDYFGAPGQAATENTGTVAGTVAAGNDSRITGALQLGNLFSEIAGEGSSAQATALSNIGLGPTNRPTFGGLFLNGSITGNNNSYTMTAGGPAALSLHPILTGTAPSSIASGAKLQFNDQILDPSGQDYGLWIEEDIAPSGHTASGSRIGVQLEMHDWGSSNAGGSYTNLGDSTDLRAVYYMSSNRGGTSSNYGGQGFSLDTDCIVDTTATFIQGCANEIDIAALAGSSYLNNHGLSIVQTANQAVEGLLNNNFALGINNQADNAPGAWRYGILFGQTNSHYPMDPYSVLMLVSPAGPGRAAPISAAAFDTANETYKAYLSRSPFRKIVPLQAQAISTATRLTSDGAPASAFVSEAWLTAQGASFTSNPTVTVTGCTGAVVNAQIATAQVGPTGVYTPGSACASDASASVSGGGGSGAAINLDIQGNTLNFPTQTVVDVKCRVAARDGALGIGWSIDFGALQNGTASTTTIIGTPSWAQDFANGAAASDISIAAPTADQTLGAINITITPTTGTWNVGGSCVMVGSRQVL